MFFRCVRFNIFSLAEIIAAFRFYHIVNVMFFFLWPHLWLNILSWCALFFPRVYISSVHLCTMQPDTRSIQSSSVNVKMLNVVYCMCISENTIIVCNGWLASLVKVFHPSQKLVRKCNEKWRERAPKKNNKAYINYSCTCFQCAVFRNSLWKLATKDFPP